MSQISTVQPPSRVLMGPGPSDVPPSVLEALARPTIGHLDPVFIQIMDEVRTLLQAALGTTNPMTLPISATGSAGMETCIVNLVEPGDKVLVAVNGVFGGRMCEVARRAGAEVTEVKIPWGEPVTPDILKTAAAGRSYKLFCLVHAETSTGALSALDGMGALAREHNALLLVDAVTSLGGLPVDMDRHGIDALYSGSQKCLSCPPGLSPISLSSRALAVLTQRQRPPQSWYLDLTLLARYWGAALDGQSPSVKRAYHHTAPVNMVYALHESLRLAIEEGLQARFQRHARHSRALVAGLEEMGLSLVVAPAARMPQLTVVRSPAGIDEAAIRTRLLEEHGLEIGGGLGDLAGQVWRIGLMGAAATRRNVTLCLSAISSALAAEGHVVAGDPLAAARKVYGQASA